MKSRCITSTKLFCEYDEYDENCLLNKVIKTSIQYLIKSPRIGSTIKVELKKLILYFSKTDLIEINEIRWDQLIFNRNNSSYKNIVDICRLILEGLIVSDEKGKNKYKEFLDAKKASTIYENFIKQYYRKHYPMFKATAKTFNINPNGINYIPVKRTDIFLEYEDRMLIIDAKFYSQILEEGYMGMSKVISSDNLNQIYVYVDSQDPYKEKNIKGMLLYAQTINEPAIDICYPMIGHEIFIKTLDMNSEWNTIKSSLNNIAECFIKDNWDKKRV